MFGLGLGRMGSVGRSGNSIESQIAALFTGKPGLRVDRFSNFANLYQDSAGATPITAYEQVVGKANDTSGNSNNLQQATTTARPKVQTSSGASYLTFDGVDDGLATATFTAGTLTSNMDCFIVLERNSAAVAPVGFGGSSAGGGVERYFACLGTTNGTPAGVSVGTPTYKVNGNDINGGAVGATRQQITAAFPIGSFVVLEALNLNLSSWVFFGASGYPAYCLNGQIAAIYLRPAMTTAERNALRTYAGAQVGLVL